MPGCFLTDTTQYSLYDPGDGTGYKLVFKGKIDNGGLSPIESDGIDNVARGFFFQEVTYGFNSLDGFVVWYQTSTNTWAQTSLILTQEQFDLGATDVNLTDLTTYPDNGNWECSVSLDASPSPAWEEVICSRDVVGSSSFSTKQVKYVQYMVVNGIGYRFTGDESGISEWVFSGQITLDVDQASTLSMSLALAAGAVLASALY